MITCQMLLSSTKTRHCEKLCSCTFLRDTEIEECLCECLWNVRCRALFMETIILLFHNFAVVKQVSNTFHLPTLYQFLAVIRRNCVIRYLTQLVFLFFSLATISFSLCGLDCMIDSNVKRFKEIHFLIYRRTCFADTSCTVFIIQVTCKNANSVTFHIQSFLKTIYL